MAFWTAWLARTPTEIDAPPDAPVEIEISGADGDEEIEVQELELGEKISVEPVFVVIEYTDSRGTASRRRVSFISIANNESGAVLYATCHERKAFRSFRIDRIGSVISLGSRLN